MRKKVISIFLVLLMLLSITGNAFAAGITYPIDLTDMPNSENWILISVSEESVYYPPTSEIMPLTYGNYPLYTTVYTYTEPSPGLVERDSVTGILVDIASVVLAFGGKYVPVPVSAAATLLGIALTEPRYSTYRALTSYRRVYKVGAARWSDETAYTPWIYSGTTEYYKHIHGALLNADDTWTTYTYDYPDPDYTVPGEFYNNSDSWFKDKAYECASAENMIIDLPW